MLIIKKYSSGAWWFQQTGLQPLEWGKFYHKFIGDYFKIVEAGGSVGLNYGTNRDGIIYSDIRLVIGDGGGEQSFASAKLLNDALLANGFPGFEFGGTVVIADLISSDSPNAIIEGTDGKLYSSPTGGAAVDSVNGLTGAVTIDGDNINVYNPVEAGTSDLNEALQDLADGIPSDGEYVPTAGTGSNPITGAVVSHATWSVTNNDETEGYSVDPNVGASWIFGDYKVIIDAEGLIVQSLAEQYQFRIKQGEILFGNETYNLTTKNENLTAERTQQIADADGTPVFSIEQDGITYVADDAGNVELPSGGGGISDVTGVANETTVSDDGTGGKIVGLADDVIIEDRLRVTGDPSAAFKTEFDTNLDGYLVRLKASLGGLPTGSEQYAHVQVSGEEGEALMRSVDDNYSYPGTTVVNRVFTNPSYGSVLELNMDGTINSYMRLALTGNADGGEAVFQDERTVPKGLEYFDDYSAGFSNRSLVDKGYADSKIVSSIANGDTTHAPNGDVVFDALATINNDISTKDDTFIITPVKTANYNGGASLFIPFNLTSSLVSNLPTTPNNGTRVGYKIVALTGSNTLTINCAAGDVLNIAGGATSATLSVLNQVVIFQYNSGIWYATDSSISKTYIDAQDALKESSANKQNSLTADGTGVKFPTVDAILAELAKYRKDIIAHDNVTTSTLTGTTNQIVYAKVIPIGSTPIGSDFELNFTINKIGGSGNNTIRVYINTSAAIGGTQIGTYTAGATLLSVPFRRQFIVKSGGLLGISAATSMLSDYSASTVGSTLWAGYNNAVTQYLVVAIQLGAGSTDSVTGEQFSMIGN